jgi:hypothetical protein
MFYKESDIYEALACVVCHQTLDDPRTLPCAASACNKCIQELIKSNNESAFDCSVCKDKHKPLSEKGFPSNSNLLKLVQSRVDKVYRNKNVVNLQEKLSEIKKKCGELKYNLKNPDDKIREYCIGLRNKVDLETEKLIEQARQYNESLIGEINKYEQDCINSCKDKIGSYLKDYEYELVVAETSKFVDNESNYLSEHNIDDKYVDNLLVQADVHLDKLILRDTLLKGIMFNGKLMEFIKNNNERDQSLLGKIALKQLIYEPISFKELKFDDQVLTNFHSHFSLFKLENGNNVAFYIDTGYYLNMVTFDNGGKVITRIPNMIVNVQIERISIVKLFKTFILNVYLRANSSSIQFRGNRTKPSSQNCFEENNSAFRGISFVIDENANYVQHKVLNYLQLFMTANTSSIICIDSSYNYYYYDIDFNIKTDKSFDKIKQEVGQTVIDLEMNDRYIFILCNTKKLKIFDADTLDLVKEIDVTANQIKVVSTSHFILFDSIYRLIQLHDPCANFARLHDVDLAQSVETGFNIARDRTKHLTFFNRDMMKSNSSE